MSAMIQFRVIYALVIRELHTRYGRENIGFLWMIGEPILFCGGVAIVWTAMRPAHEHGLPVTAFVITGYVPLTMWRHSVARAAKAFESNGSLLFHRFVTPLDILIARAFLEIFGTIAAGCLISAVAIVTGFMKPPASVGLVYAGLFYQAMFCLGFALIIASISEMSELVEKGLVVLMYLAIPLSGAFIMVDWVPQTFQAVLLWSPSVHNIEMIRGGQFGPLAKVHYDLFYDSWVTGLMLLVGLSLTLRVRRHLVVQ